MKKILVFCALLIVAGLVVVSARNMFVSDASSQGGDYYAPTDGEVQQVSLELVNLEYTMTPNKVVAGVPVRMTVDASTLAGCMKTVMIRDFGVVKYITPSDNVIEFTPTKTGKFWITCSMGMGAGQFEVVRPDGSSDTAAPVTPPPAHTCGAGGGGCGGGCGGNYG